MSTSSPATDARRILCQRRAICPGARSRQGWRVAWLAVLCTGGLTSQVLGQELLEDLPAGGDIYLYWSGNQYHQDFERSALGQLHAEPQVAAFVAGLRDCASHALSQQGVDPTALGLLQKAWPIFQSPGAVVVFLRDEKSRTLLEEPAALFVLQGGDDVESVLQSLESLISNVDPDGLPFAEVELAGRPFRQTRDGQVVWGAVGSRLWAARGAGGRGRLSDQLMDVSAQPALGKARSYRRARERLALSNWLFGAHVRVSAVRQSVLKQVRRLQGTRQSGRVDFIAGLCDVLAGDGQWLTFANGFAGRQLQWGLFLATEHDRGLAELFYRRPVDRDNLRWVPRGATFCLSANLDLRTVEYRFLSVFLRERAAGRHSGLAMVEWFADWLEKRLGVEIRREILSQLEPTWVFYTLPDPRNPTRISRVVVLQTPDGRVFHGSCQRLAEALEDRLGLQVTYHHDSPPGRWEIAAGTVTVTWAVAGQCVVISDSPSALQEVFDRGGGPLSKKRSILGRRDAWRSMQAVPTNASLIAYADTREQAAFFLRDYTCFRKANVYGPAAELASRLPDAPPLQTVRKHLINGEVLSLTHHPDGVLLAGQGDLPFRLGMTVGTAAGAATALALTLYDVEPPAPPAAPAPAAPPASPEPPAE